MRIVPINHSGFSSNFSATLHPWFPEDACAFKYTLSAEIRAISEPENKASKHKSKKHIINNVVISNSFFLIKRKILFFTDVILQLLPV